MSMDKITIHEQVSWFLFNAYSWQNKDHVQKAERTTKQFLQSGYVKQVVMLRFRIIKMLP